MTDMKNMMIADESLEGVLGGVIVTVHNDACGYANIRHEPSLNGIIAMKAKNGTRLNTVVNEYIQPVSADGYVWYPVTLEKGSDIAWIAGSMIGY